MQSLDEKLAIIAQFPGAFESWKGSVMVANDSSDEEAGKAMSYLADPVTDVFIDDEGRLRIDTKHMGSFMWEDDVWVDDEGLVYAKEDDGSDGKTEKCAHCGSEFEADQGDYHPPGRIECPKCGADNDAEHDEDYNRAMAIQDKTVKEGVMENKDTDDFDKFMEGIVKEEENRKVRQVDVSQDTPARLYQKRYREYHNNRIVYRGTR